MNVSDGWRPLKGQLDYFGQEIPDRIYDCTDYDYNIVLEDRIREVAELNEDMLKLNPDYVVRITGSDAYGKSKLSYFISVRERFPVIATTSELLSTGVDAKMVK